MTQPVGRKGGRYAVTPNGKHTAPSVTMVLGTLNKPGLSWGAAKETALYAVHHRDEWLHLPEDEAAEKLRRHHRGVWDEKAANGTSVHNIACAWASGIEVEVPPELDGYVDALEAFYVTHRPQWVQVERSVVYSVKGREYGGSFDATGTFADGRRWLIDFKTGGRYPTETRLQLAAYRYAEGLAVYDEAGQLVDTELMPTVDACGVVYLHHDGTFELLEVEARKDEHVVFLKLRDTWAWQQEAEKWLKATPEKRVGLAQEEAVA